MQFLVIIFGIYFCGTALSQRPNVEDPLCVTRNCQPGQFCRVQKECNSAGSHCRLVAICLDRQVPGSHTGVCLTGHPILESYSTGQLQDLTCGPRFPCVNGSHCNAQLMDTYATCCRDHPDQTVKAGECPPQRRSDDYCVDECGNDGDCDWDNKCCQTGCNKECVRPIPVDPCRGTRCPQNSYCLREGMTSCPRPGRCYSPGDCVPCEAVSCNSPCQYGSVLDPSGCPTCTCMPPPLPQLPEAPRINIRVSRPDGSSGAN